MRGDDQLLEAIQALPSSTRREEMAHALTHGFGLFASLIGSVILVMAAWTRGEARHVVGASVFGMSLILLYGASTLYHSWREPVRKQLFQRLDYISIYLLIAGTYTPIALISMRDDQGLQLLIAAWALAFLGIALEFVRTGTKRTSSIALYLAMGWMAVAVLEPLLRTIEPDGIKLLVLGGLLYTSGVIFYAWDRLPYNHAIWHGFVLVGSGLHFGCVFYFVIP